MFLSVLVRRVRLKHFSLPPCLDPSARVRAAAGRGLPGVAVLLARRGPARQRGELHQDAVGGGQGEGNRNPAGSGHSGERKKNEAIS